MTPATERALWSAHTASGAVQAACDAFIADGLTDAAVVLRQAGEQIAHALGLLVRAEAEKRKAAEVQP